MKINETFIEDHFKFLEEWNDIKRITICVETENNGVTSYDSDYGLSVYGEGLTIEGSLDNLRLHKKLFEKNLNNE